MKIKKIKFIKYKHFKENHEVIFEENGNIPNITFLVGDNGSGKTAVLDAIFYIYDITSAKEDFSIDYFIELSANEMLVGGISHNDISLHLSKANPGGFQMVITRSSNGARINFPLDKIKKGIFSTVETNFSEPNFTTVTAKSIDDKLLPKEKSLNLSAEIPQLLIDIKNADSNELVDYLERNGYKGGRPPLNIGSRLRRFTNTFHEMYAGSKIFKEIKDMNGQKNLMFTDKSGCDISLNQLSTGEKQIIYRIGYLLRNLKNITSGIVLIDEPEISLHPIWQSRIKNIIKKTFENLNVQLIIATHSPYIFQEFDARDESCIKVSPLSETSKSISLGTAKIELQKSTNYISYIAYGIVNIALHIELYTLLQKQENKEYIEDMEKWLKDPSKGNIKKVKSFKRTKKYQKQIIGTKVIETLPTYIRNALHHGDEAARTYTQKELKDSINLLLSLLG